MSDSLISLRNVNKYYGSGSHALHVLKNINLDIKSDEFVAIMGPSGSGKSTLLNVMGLLDHFDQGAYSLAGTEVTGLDENKSAHLRNKMLGFVFQSFNLLPYLNAMENVALPLTYRKMKPQERDELALQYLDYVGLKDRAHHHPSELSGGQCQRVAIARALVTKPNVIFADEPTGALDSNTSVEIMDLFKQMHNEGRCLIMVTHADDVARAASRVIYVRDGQVQ